MTSQRYRALIRDPVTGDIVNTLYGKTVAELCKIILDGGHLNFLPEGERPKYHQLYTIRSNAKPISKSVNNPRQIVQILRPDEEPVWPPLRPKIDLDNLGQVQVQEVDQLNHSLQSLSLVNEENLQAAIANNQVTFDDVIAKLFELDPKGRMTATEIATKVNQCIPETNFTPVTIGRLMVKNKTPFTHSCGSKHYHVRFANNHPTN